VPNIEAELVKAQEMLASLNEEAEQARDKMAQEIEDYKRAASEKIMKENNFFSLGNFESMDFISSARDFPFKR